MRATTAGAEVRMENKLAFKGMLQGLSLMILGVFLLALAATVPVFASAPVLAFFLMSVPAFFSGAVALLHGLAVISACIAITDSELTLIVPEWRVFPILPVRRISLKWDELLAIRHRKEVYQLLAAFSFPVDVFALDTTKGRIVLGERSIPGMRRALMEVAGRCRLVIQEEGEVSLGVVHTLLKGSPPWHDGEKDDGLPL